MRILVFGAGAVGSVLGGLLARAGNAVTLLGRPDHSTAIRQRGLAIEGIWGSHHVRELQTASLPADVSGQEFEDRKSVV